MTSSPLFKTVTVNGIELGYYEKGQGPLVLCLHGFPDTAKGMLPMLEYLAGEGYRAVAPFLRGYYPSALAPDGDYGLPTLARDMLALIDALYEGEGDAKASVIGHDWGGLIAYHGANLAPEKIHTLTVLAVPHMHSAKMNWQQFKNIWYTLFFQLPYLPEYIVSRNHFAFIDKLYRLWSPSWQSSADSIGYFKEMLAQPKVLEATLAYYRCMVRKATPEAKALLVQKTDVPALWFMGREDGCVDVSQVKDIASSFPQGVDLHVVDGAGHFPHCEKPEVVYAALGPFLARHY